MCVFLSQNLLQLQEAFAKGELNDGLTVKVATPRVYAYNQVRHKSTFMVKRN